ncbi:MAG TPA: hypothetical protein ENN29_12350 [Candidatus Hydrogenedentes bacterium]|nr:hypothetical protein [Candidatus Hydrogenedentota bacterium]
MKWNTSLGRGASAFFSAILVFAAMTHAAAGQSGPDNAEKWQGFDSRAVELDGRVCTLVAPDEAADGMPWALYATAPDPESPLNRRLLAKGFHIAWMDIDELYGNAAAVEHWDALYAWARENFALAEKPALVCERHGALLAYGWAARNSDKAACIYADEPWLQLKPTAGQETPDAVMAQAQAAHDVTDPEQTDITPLGHAATVGEAEIPVMHLYAGRRPGVAPDKSIEQFYSIYRFAGRGEYESFFKPAISEGSRHDLTVAALVFLLKHTGALPGMPMETPIAAMPHWKVADFAGRAEVRVLDDILVIEQGNDMTGIVCAQEPPLCNYEIMLDAMRLSGGDFFCGLTAPYKNTCFSLIVGGWGGTCVGISSIDWLDAYHNETAVFRSFDDHRWYRIRLRVTDGAIQAWIDGKETVTLDVADRDLDIRWEMAPTTPLGVATWRTTGAIKNFSIRRIEDIQNMPL